MEKDNHDLDAHKMRLIERIIKTDDRLLLARLSAVFVRDFVEKSTTKVVEKEKELSSATLKELLSISFDRTKPYEVQFFDEEPITVKTWKDFYVEALSRLILTGVITAQDCPISDFHGASRYCVHTIEQHKNGKRFTIPAEVGDLHIECHYNSKGLIENLGKLFQLFGQKTDAVRVWYR